VYSSIQVRFYVVRPILLIMIVECFTWQALTCEWHKCKSFLEHANVIISCISRDVFFFSSALPHRSSLRNLTLVVGQYYPSKKHLSAKCRRTDYAGCSTQDGFRRDEHKTLLILYLSGKGMVLSYKLYCELQTIANLLCFLCSSIQLFVVCRWGTWV